MGRYLSAFLGLFLAGISTHASAEGTPLRIGVGGQATIYHLPLAVAVHRGFFQEQGLNVEVVDFPGGGKAMQALIAGAVDVVSGAYEHTLRARARGMATQAFVLASTSPQIAMAVSSTNLPGYRDLTDLRGKVIGISAPGSSTQMVAGLMLKQAGVHPDEVSFVGVGTGAAALDALRSGKVDALANSEPLMSLLQRNDNVRIVADARTALGTAQLFDGPVPANVLLARNRYIVDNPRTIQSIANAMVNALIWMQQASPVELSEVLPQAWQMNDPDLYQQVLGSAKTVLNSDGRFSAQGVQNLLRTLYSFDSTLDALAIDSDQTWTNEFVDNAGYDIP